MGGKCVGCGAEADRHPYVGIGRGAIDGRPVGKFYAHPVCLRCWQDPAHRKRTLKLHYFQTEHSAEAVRLAGATTLG